MEFVKSMTRLEALDLTYPTTAQNLALDEALLEECHSGARGPVIRFWMPESHAVVLGYSRPVAADVDLEACRRDRVGLERRYSGGGTVLQGPGVLNYAVILPLGMEPRLSSVTGAHRFVLERTAQAVSILAGRSVGLRGDSDLALGEMKFSGNAQRRTARALLVHGTVLLGLDISLVGRYLKVPDRQPPYRASRSHEAFLVNLGLSASEVRAELREAWGATDEAATLPHREVERLVRDRYATGAWIFRR